jgi:uncharacterized sodium:solute symporter family permease YidK
VPEHPPAADHGKADRTLRVGIAVTVLGLICALIALSPLVIPNWQPSGVWWFLSMLIGVGLIIIFLGLTRSARSRRKPSRP